MGGIMDSKWARNNPRTVQNGANMVLSRVTEAPWEGEFHKQSTNAEGTK